MSSRTTAAGTCFEPNRRVSRMAEWLLAVLSSMRRSSGGQGTLLWVRLLRIQLQLARDNPAPARQSHNGGVKGWSRPTLQKETWVLFKQQCTDERACS